MLATSSGLPTDCVRSRCRQAAPLEKMRPLLWDEIMQLLHRLLGLLWGPTLRQRAQRLARDSYAQVRMLVEGRCAHLSPAEARGYLRARATPVLVAALRSQGGLSVRAQRLVLGMAGELLADVLLADLAAVTVRDRRRAA
jgi:hypothetical protein